MKKTLCTLLLVSLLAVMAFPALAINSCSIAYPCTLTVPSKITLQVAVTGTTTLNADSSSTTNKDVTSATPLNLGGTGLNAAGASVDDKCFDVTVWSNMPWAVTMQRDGFWNIPTNPNLYYYTTTGSGIPVDSNFTKPFRDSSSIYVIDTGLFAANGKLNHVWVRTKYDWNTIPGTYNTKITFVAYQL